MSWNTIKFSTTVPSVKPEDRFGISMCIVAEVPFIPRKGDIIAVTPDGDLFIVDQLYWTPDVGIEIVLDPEPGNHAKDNILREAGWVNEP